MGSVMSESMAGESGPGIVLETARLRLRRLTADDLDCLMDLNADPEVMRYITGGVPTPP
jgi:RimJ/RimL family protein N-acetyltransferase